MPEPGESRFRYPVAVRFRDLDPMGHVHHTVALVYFEEARAAYWRDVVGQSNVADVGYVVARFAIDYHARVHFPQTVYVRARVPRLGGKSWDMEYELRSATGELFASATSVQVMYDYEAGASIAIPDDVRRRIAAYEGLEG